MLNGFLIRRSDHLPLVVAAVFFLQTLDGSILNTSLPQVARAFDVTAVDMNAGITSYLISAAALMPLSAWFAGRLGVRRTLSSALSIFIVASVLCGLVHSLPQFVAARILQGAGAALMVPVGRIAVMKSTSKGDLLRAISLLTWPALLAPVAGPWLGGSITTWVGWQFNFFVNLPLGLICLALVQGVVPVGDIDPGMPLDVKGAALISLALAFIIYGLDWLTNIRTSAHIIGATLVLAGVLTGWRALAWLRKTPTPLINPAILRIKTFAVATYGATNLVKVAIAVTPFLLPLFVQLVWKMSPIGAGSVMLVYFSGNLLMKLITSPIIRLLGFRVTLVGAGVVVALSTAAFPMLDWHGLTSEHCLLLLVAGGSRSLFFTAANTLTFSDVPPDLTASASTFSSMMQQVSLALGVGIAALSLTVVQFLSNGPEPTTSNFHSAFLFSAILAAVGVALTMRLPASAGEDVRRA